MSRNNIDITTQIHITQPSRTKLSQSCFVFARNFYKPSNGIAKGSTRIYYNHRVLRTGHY